MDPEILPVVVPTVTWEKLIPGCIAALDRSIVASLDSKGIPIGNLASYLGALAELRREGSDPEKAVRDSHQLRRHIWFSFLIGCTSKIKDELSDCQYQGLAVMFAEHKQDHAVVVMSGTVEAWAFSVEDRLRRESPRDVRILFGKIYLWLVQQGLGAMFNKSKTEVGDGTFYLQ